MKKFLIKLFCSHKKYKEYFTSDGIELYSENRYYDDYIIRKFEKCNKTINTCDI